ncbi:glycosyltransferase family 2 protein [Methanobrevibacter sp.]|uniref:glycosyltransferase family 2 protein n=1 Tax=Methanobrevibacter sp. TaxID=66852 RepID=UPI002E776698|nr:glycosyltransferase family 2 protein [Methanobrevibacter sp.]MEE1336833.1 glycosyltransferase family 2 protein [Methanobrevibacter sp.]
MDNDKPFISVLIPSLNSQDYIKQCVESVIDQTLEDIEILCIDAGSDDKTLEILNQLAVEDSRISIFNSDKRSYGYQMNIGLDNSSGEYIAIVESDDFIEKNMLADLYDLARQYDADIVKSTFYHFYDAPGSEKSKEINESKKGLKNIDAFTLLEQPLIINGHPSIWAGIYKNSFLKENNIRFIEEKGAGWVDNPFFYETAFSAKRIIYRHVPYYNYRETNLNSSSNALNDFTIPIRRMMDNMDIVEKYGCKDEFVLKQVYLRAFAYIYNILRRDGHEEHMSELRPLIQEMLLRLDENIVLKYLRRKHIDNYYKFLSPIPIIDDDKFEVVITHKDLELIKKENEYLYSQIKKYKKKNRSLKKENKLIKNSNAYKLASTFSKPFRKLK